MTASAEITLPPGVEVLGYQWELGDGTEDIGATVVHTYAARGRYKVHLRAATTAGTLSDTQILDVPTTDSAVYPNCMPVCSVDAFILWNPGSRRFEARASLTFERPSSTEDPMYLGLWVFDPAIRAQVRNSRDAVLWDSDWTYYRPGSSAPGTKTATVDMSRINELLPIESELEPGSYYLYLFLAKVETSDGIWPPIHLVEDRGQVFWQGRADFTTVRNECPYCEIQPPGFALVDGHRTQFSVSNPNPPASNPWSGFAPKITDPAVPPGITLSRSAAPGSDRVDVMADWYPDPPVRDEATDIQRNYQALHGAVYVIKYENGGKETVANLRVTLPWLTSGGTYSEFKVPLGDGRWAIAKTEPPQLLVPSDNLATTCDSTHCWVVPPHSSTLVRTAPEIRVGRGLTPSSAFYRKLITVHEGDHVDFFTNPNRCGYRLWTPERFLQQYQQCLTDGFSLTPCKAQIENGRALQAREEARKNFKNFVMWFNSGWVEDAFGARRDQVMDLLEREAYAKSNATPPLYFNLPKGPPFACPVQ